MKAWTTLFVISMFLTAVAMADDVDDVKAAMQSYFDAINSGNGAAIAWHRIPEYSSLVRGGLIDRSSSMTQQRDAMQAMTDAGWKRDYRIQHMEVRVYGNAAVVTGYLTGTNTAPDGTVIQTREQRTGVLIKQGGQWKEVHRHASPLSSLQAQSALEGAWKMEEVTINEGPNAGTNTNPQPSLFIFTKQHYNIMYVRGTEPRPLLEEGSSRTTITQAEMRATFVPFVANSGTYELNGSTLTTNPNVALWPNFMSGGTGTFDYRVEGNSLWLTYRYGPANGMRLKLVRVE